MPEHDAARDIPIPRDDVRLQDVLRALGCRMHVVGAGRETVSWPIRGYRSWDSREQTLERSMPSLRASFEPLGLRTIGQLHEYLIDREMGVTASPDWGAIRIIAIGGDENS
jgi:hypothetical protein